MQSGYVPVESVAALDLRQATHGGLLLPIKKHDDPMAVTVRDGEKFGIVLSGHHSFVSFRVSLQSPHAGLFFAAPKILVDYSSAVSALGKDEEVGLLVLDEKEVSVIASPAGNNLSFPSKYPLWGVPDAGSSDISVAFSRWAFALLIGTEYKILWERTPT